jgi:peroxiredoxin
VDSVSAHDPSVLPDDLPIPVDDGACDDLPGRTVPSLVFPSTVSEEVELGEFARDLAVLFCYPRTGTPGVDPPPGWDAVPGARGCTPQACGFRDLQEQLDAAGARVAGLSTQSHLDQLEFAQRSGIRYPLLSDPELRLAAALGMPTFSIAGMTLYRRATLVLEQGRVAKVFYPVFPPDRNAADVLAWLAQSRHKA